MSVDGDSHPPTRQSQLWARLAQIVAEGEQILRELRGEEGEEEDSPEKRRAALRVLQGGLVVVLIGAALGMVSAAGWAGRHRVQLATAAASAGTAAVLATALLSQGSPSPHAHAGAPPVRPGATVTAVPRASAAVPSPSVKPVPPRTPGVPSIPVLVPTRIRRATVSASVSGVASSPAGPSPTPVRPGPTPTGSPPPPFVCPAGLVLQVLGVGLYVCV